MHACVARFVTSSGNSDEHLAVKQAGSKTIMSLLAIDIGSSRCKAVVFALTGEILAQHAYAYTPGFPRSFARGDKSRDAFGSQCALFASGIEESY